METLLIFRLDERQYGCYARAVQRVIWSVEITPLPGAYEKVLGVVNVEEIVVPIVDLRKIIGLQPKSLELDDDIVIMQSKYGPVGFVVDTVEGIAEYPSDWLAPITEAIKSYASNVLRTGQDLLVIVDPSKLVTEDDLPDAEELRLTQV